MMETKSGSSVSRREFFQIATLAGSVLVIPHSLGASLASGGGVESCEGDWRS